MALRDVKIINGYRTPVWRVCDAVGCGVLAERETEEMALCDAHYRQEYGCRVCGELPAVCECDEPRYEPSCKVKTDAEWR